jgi:hypothetical protein
MVLSFFEQIKKLERAFKIRQKKPHSRRVRKIAMKKMVSYETYRSKYTKKTNLKKNKIC